MVYRNPDSRCLLPSFPRKRESRRRQPIRIQWQRGGSMQDPPRFFVDGSLATGPAARIRIRAEP